MPKKKPSKSEKSASSSPSVNAASNERSRMVLRAKSTEKMKRLALLSRESEEEWRPKSAKSVKTAGGKKGVKLDAKMPKKPPTAFFYFLEDFRKDYKEQNPDVISMRDIGKACGEKWKTMSYEEKVQYYDIANEKRREFDKAMAAYIKRKESGEDEETEDDSNFE
ncbi:hypothetical protein BT93_D0329 [Corymbia citriodora subsp. variegata]|nr:hypothetical protein BT93_D0329 [Corymbia citriodora subsp. variegata]